MVRFTLFCRSKGENMRMEISGREPVEEVGATVRDYFGHGFMLRNGYILLHPGAHVGDCIGDGDVVEVIPDPESLFRTVDIHGT